MDAVIRKQLKIRACKARMGIIEGVFNAKSGHPGGSLSCVDILTYLYFDHMNIDPQDPKNEDRDRFVLSKGHAAPALYSVLALRGFFPVEELKTLRKSDSMLQGHPSVKYTPGVDMCTGSLGQGISARLRHGSRRKARRQGLQSLHRPRRRRDTGGSGLGGCYVCLCKGPRQPRGGR